MKLTPIPLIALCLCAALTACKKSNSAPPAMIATIDDTTYQFTSVANFHTVTDSIFAFNMKMKQSSTDSFYIFLEFRGAFQLNVPIDSYTQPVFFIFSNFGSLNYSAGYTDPGLGKQGHLVVTVTTLDTTQHSIAGTFNGMAITSPADNDSVAISGNFNTSYIDN